MSQLFDTYEHSYRDIVQSSIDFSGLPHSFFYAAKADMMRDLIADRFGAASRPSALDVGCGIGMFHPFVRDVFGQLHGVDQSAGSIERAQTENPDVEYKFYLGSRLPYDDAAFDLTYAICVLHHVPPSEWISFLREMRRVTRPGGSVCVIEHNPLNPLTQLSVRRCEFDRDAVLLSARRTEKLMRQAGLSGPESRHFLLLPSAALLARRIEQGLARWPMGAQYMAAAGA
jgi:SAM-dependent methyltransferase